MQPEVKAGDKIRIRTVKETIEGILLESYQSDIFLIKLKSGYNIGIKKEDVVSMEKIEDEKKEGKQKEIKQIQKAGKKPKVNLPNVDMIITGGTISSRLDSETGGVNWLTKPEQLFEFYPELLDIVNVRKIKIPFMKASENMDYLDWKEIARQAEESLNDKEIEGVIITHGTDFLHYTSSALSFFLQNLNKPVVLTYAQRSSDRASSDASLNLVCAARAAVSDIAEVMIVGHASMDDNFCFAIKGSKVRKMHSSRRDAFKPINSKPIAKIFPDGKIEILSSCNKRDNNKKVILDDKFNDKIALIKFYPGMDTEIFDFLGRYEGVVLEGTGLGHIATGEARNNLLPAIKKAIDNGLIVCMTTQTLNGRVDPYVYSPGREVLKAGVIFLEDILPETAYVKLGYIMAKTKYPDRIKKLMLTNIAGELNSRLEE